MSQKPETISKTVRASFTGKKSYDHVRLLINFVKLAEIDWAFVKFLPENQRFAENRVKIEDGEYHVKYSIGDKTIEQKMSVSRGRLAPVLTESGARCFHIHHGAECLSGEA